MADEIKNPAPPETPAPDASAGTLNTAPSDAKKDEERIPYSRLAEEVSKRKALEDRLAQLEKADADAKKAEQAKARKEAEEQGKFKDLLTAAEARVQELEPLAAEIKGYRDFFQKTLDRRMANVPDHLKTLLAKMNPLEAMTWLEENADKLSPRQAPPTDAGTPSERRNGSAFTGSAEHVQEVMKRFALKR